MKRLIIILLVLTLFLPLVSCNEQDDQSDKPDIGMPTPEPLDGSSIDLDRQFDNSTNFSYITYKAGYNTTPYFENNAEFPDNIFIYETNTSHIGDVKMYGYMNENFEKLSEPISLSPNVFTMGVAMIDSEDGAYIANKDFKNTLELGHGYALVDNGIVKVTWGSNLPDNVTVSTITDPDTYLVPVKADTGLISEGRTVYIYGYKTASSFSSGNSSDEDFFIEPIFEDARPFFNGLAAVKSNGMWGYIDKNGNTVIDFIYHDAKDFIATSSFVFQGKMKTYTYSSTRSEEVFEGYWALIDKDGNELTEFNIREANAFYNGWAIVPYATLEKFEVDGKKYIHDTNRTLYNYINIDGENYFDVSQNNFTLGQFIDSIAASYVSSGYRFYNDYGDWLFNTSFYRARTFSDGLAAVKTGNNSRSWTYIDLNGIATVKERFLLVNDFNNGYAYVVKEFMKPGFIINKLGNKYLEALNIYGMTKFNDEGYALAYTIVDKNETTQEWLYYMIHIENN